MPPQLHHDDNPFQSPEKPAESVTPTTAKTDKRARQIDVLATADLFLGQLKELEDLCSTVEDRVQRKRQALKELEYLISGLNTKDKSPYSPACPTNTPTNASNVLLCPVSPRLRGLFDIHGPGRVNIDSTQSCLDYSPETQIEDTHEDGRPLEEWVDEGDDEEALVSPFDDKYAFGQGVSKVEKDMPATPPERSRGVLESKIPRKVQVRRQLSTSKRSICVGRPVAPVMRTISRERRPSLRNVKVPNAPSEIATKGTMRRSSWKRSIENTKVKRGIKGSGTDENESAKENAPKKEKKKGLWSIYSVCASDGQNGTQYYHAI